ncbi:NB-ARC domain-containing protein [Streptomyces sp. NPDC017529]|uniref:phosphorylase family protein n=1 Tax=Streptomyces sp. NPDC017529 TaxID=3365000 RepID=UPI00379A9384
MAEPNSHPTIVILTALSLEYEAVRDHLTGIERLVHPTTGTRAERGVLPGTPWHIALVWIDSGTLNAAILTGLLNAWLKPQALFFVGVAGGLKDDIDIGDVVIATKIYAYDGGKHSEDGFLTRPEAWHAPQRLKSAAFTALRGRTDVHFEPVAVANIVLVDPASATAALIKRHYEDAAAVEMEGSGVAHAAHLTGDLEALVIRGISDKADPGKAEADEGGSQPRAAANAAMAAIAIIRELDPRPVNARHSGGDHINIGHGATFHEAVIGKEVDGQGRQSGQSGRAAIYSVPSPEPRDIPRPEIARELVASLTSEETGVVAMTTALAGAGGFGKTTMARMLVHDRQVRDLFPDGILWIQLNEGLKDAALAETIDNVCAVVSGSKPPYTDPLAAGAELGALLGDRRFLLVIDDAWHQDQLNPLLIGGPHCVRLVTTRRHSVVPYGAAAVDVDAMTAMEARALLTSGLGQVPEAAQADLLGITGRWPVLLRLVNGAARDDIKRGADAAVALVELRDQLRESGLTALDAADRRDRTKAVSMTVKISMKRLTPAQKRRFHELAIFPEDVKVPVEVVRRYWAHTGGLNTTQVVRLLHRFADLSLLADYRRGATPFLRLHDVIRAYLRGRLRGELGRMHTRFLNAHRDLLPDGAWWQLPPDQVYLWSWVATHLRDAGLAKELRTSVLNPRWVTEKLEIHGAAAIATDLALPADPVAADLASVIQQNAHLLAELEPRGSVAATLASRILAAAPAAPISTALLQAQAGPYLAMTSPPPDLPHAALMRVLTRDVQLARSLATTPDGKVLAVGTTDGTLILWDGGTGAQAGSFRHGEPINALEMSADGAWLASAADGVRLWDMAMTVERPALAGPRGPVLCLASTGDGRTLAAGGEDQTVWVWDTETGALRYRLEDHQSPVSVIAISIDGRFLASAGGDLNRDTHIRLWDLETGDLRCELPGHEFATRVMAFAACSSSLISAGDGVVRAWDLTTGTALWEIDSGRKFVRAMIVGSDGEWIAGAGGNLMEDDGGFVGVWDLDGREPRARWRVDGLPMQDALALSADGDLLISGGGGVAGRNDAYLRVWDVTSGLRRSTLVGHALSVQKIVAPPHGQWIASLADDATVRVWHHGTGVAPPAEEGVASLAIDRSGRRLVSANYTSLRVWNAEDGTVERTLEAGDSEIEAVAFGPDGSWLASAGRDRLVRVWQTDGWAGPRELGPHSFWVTDLVPAMPFHVAACDGSLRIWDVRSGIEAATEFAGLADPLLVIAVAPDFEWIAGGGGERTSLTENPVHVRVLTTGRLHTLPGHRRDISALAPAPDGSWLASTGDHRVLIWDPREGVLRHELSDGDGLLRVLLADPTGSWLAAAGRDGGIRLWDPRTGDLHHVLTGHVGPVTALSLIKGSGGTLLVSVGQDRSIRVWDPESGKAVCSLRVDGPLAALASHGTRVHAGGARGCYFLQFGKG